jgi:hypothetical protein
LAERPVTTRQVADLFGSDVQFIADECRLPGGELFGRGRSWKVGAGWRVAYGAAVAFLHRRGISATGLTTVTVDAAGKQSPP